MTEARRIAFGDRLKLFRQAAGLNGKALAEQLGWPASKISRIENAKQAVSDGDVAAYAATLGIPAATIEELRDELRAIRVEESRWNRQLRVGHRAVQAAVAKAEQAAASIDVFSINLVPGLLQTAEYARHVFLSLSDLHDSKPDTDSAVRARVERQRILYEDGRQINLLMTEAALRFPVAPGPVMRAQIDRLVTVQGLPSLRFGIIPFGRTLPAAVAHSFVIRDGVVTVELLNTEIVTRESSDVGLYVDYLAKLWDVAEEGEHARAILARASNFLVD